MYQQERIQEPALEGQVVPRVVSPGLQEPGLNQKQERFRVCVVKCTRGDLGQVFGRGKTHFVAQETLRSGLIFLPLHLVGVRGQRY